MLRPVRVIGSALIVSMIASGPAEAWSTRMHDIICEAAWGLLSQAGQDFVAQVRTDAGVSSSKFAFASDCIWPDSSRNSTHVPTYEYHFLNVREDWDAVDPDRDCLAYDCAPVAIVRYTVYLHRGTRSPKLKEEALRFVGHFVADLHQPLHAGHASDLGGNRIAITTYQSGSFSATNLHSAWDGVIPHAAGMGSADDILEYIDTLDPAEVDSWRDFAIWEWARRSYEIAEKYAYSYPSGARIQSGATLPNDYKNEALPKAREQVAKATVRLAHILETLAAGENPFASLNPFP